MAVYYKFKSAKDYDSVPIEGHFISVANLKEKIFESKHLGRGTDFDLVISNAQTNEEYLDEGMLVPKNTSVLVRRVPGRPRMPIVAEKKEEPKETEISKDQSFAPKNGIQISESSQFKFPDDESEWDEFGNDLYALPEVSQVSQPQLPPTISNKADEDSKIRAFVDASASDWQRQTQEGMAGRGYGRGGGGGRGLAGRGFGRGMERKTPPSGYVCHRCRVPGHFIQHCPTNGDPNYDIKRVKPPTGIPKSMLVANPDGSYALPSGAVGVLRPNEAAFEKEVEGLPSSRSVGDLPPELHCPLCKEVMKDAVLTSKCCFKSYCDKCIRDYIITKSKCVCGATSILADDLLPNKTLRDTINRILETTTSSAENAGSLLQVQDMESARCPRPKVPSPSLSACAKEEAHTAPSKSDVPDLKEDNAIGKMPPGNVPQQSSEKNRTTKPVEQEGTPESMSTKELLSQESAPMVGDEVQQKPSGGEPAKKKKKKRARQQPSTNDNQWRVNQDFGAEGCMMPYGPTQYNPYWAAGAQWGSDSYMACGNGVPYMGYGPGPCDMPFGAMMPSDVYTAQSYMPGYVPPVQRDYVDYSMGSYSNAPLMSREEFEARKADLRRKREHEQRHSSKDRTRNMLIDDGDLAHSKSRLRMPSQASANLTRDDRGVSTERHRESEPSQLSPRAQAKRKIDRDEFHSKDGRLPTDSKLDTQAIGDAEVNKASKSGFSVRPDKKQKASVFSRISFPEDRDMDDVHVGPAKKRATGSHDVANGFREHERLLNGSKAHYDDGKPVKRIVNGRRHMYDDDLSDNEQNFKRKTSHRREVRELSDEWDDDKHVDSSTRTSKSLRERIHHSKV